MKIRNCLSLLALALFVGFAAELKTFPVSAGNNPRILQISPNGQGRAHVVAYSPDGQKLAVGSSLGIHLFDSADLQLINFAPTETWVRAIAFSPDGNVLASGSYDPIVRLWQGSNGALIKELPGHTAWVRAVAFSPSGSLLATASDDNTVRLWSMPEGDPLISFEKDAEGVRALAFSPDGTLLATGGYDKIIRLWQVSDGVLLRELQGHEDWVRALAFSPGGEWLASGAFDATVRLWRVADGALLSTRREHTSSVLGLAFSTDGQLLASASVDTSVRLWKMPLVEPYALLRGHTDFVFSVAYAPDGELASGAVDNTVRLWNIDALEELVPTDAGATQSGGAPQSCVACHHPQGNFAFPNGISRPVRVPDVGCVTCHREGALVLNWCPAFARSPGSQFSLSVARPEPSGLIGVSHENPVISVVIATPGNEEHFYSPKILTAVPVSGRVYYARENVTDVKVYLEIWSGSERVSTLITQPKPDGYFSFSTNISSDNVSPDVPTEKLVCTDCHSDELDPDSYLPQGEIRLRVIALTPEGEHASDERWIVVDRSQLITVNLQVEDEAGVYPVSGIPIQASTRLYEWRARNFNGITNMEGHASVQVEALGEAPTRYTFSVKPVVINGLLYESLESVEATLPPGATSAPPVTLHVRVRKGQISVQLVPPTGNSIRVRAIHMPDGAIHDAQSSAQGIFAFPELPIGRYLILADPDALAALGLVSQTQQIDLFQEPNPLIQLALTPLPDTSLSGMVHWTGGEAIPFAYVSLEASKISQAAQPDSGRISLVGLPADAHTLVVSAPGFYSRAYAVKPEHAGPLDLALVMRPETRRLSWGSGWIMLPPESRLNEKNLHITLEQGWLWGKGGGAGQPLRINLERGEIEIESGRFALEQIPGQEAWFYVFEGEAQLRVEGDTQPIVVPDGYMVVLAEDFRPVPVPYDPVVVAVLHQPNGLEIPVSWEPNLSAQVRDRLARIGISTAQIMTFITYLMAILTLLILPIIAVNWITKNKRERKHE